MKRALYIILAIFTSILILTSCTCYDKSNTKDVSVVRVKIVDESHIGKSFAPIRFGRVTSVVTRPEIYNITVEYNGSEYFLSGGSEYSKYYGNVGEYVNGVLETTSYDDGNKTYKIIGLK